MKNFRTTTALVVALAFATLTMSASAETLRTWGARANNETGTNTHFFADLGGGKTSLTFNTSAPNSLVKVTYNAECGVLGPPQSWLSVTLLVDGVQMNPASGTVFAFCTSLPNGADFQWTGATRQSLKTIPAAGTHTVQVLVDLNNGANTWWLGDTSIVVESTP